MSATSAWSTEFTLHVLHCKYPKNEKNKTHLTLAPNRGSLGVLWTYSGSDAVLSWDLTHKNWQTSTKAHACRVTLSDPKPLDTTTRGSPRLRIKHTPLHKDINLTKTYLQSSPKLLLLPCHFCVNFKMFNLNQQGDLPSAPPCRMTD